MVFQPRRKVKAQWCHMQAPVSSSDPLQETGGLPRDSWPQRRGFINPTVGISGQMSMSPDPRLEQKKGFQSKSAGSGKCTELLCTGRYRASCGPVPIKADLNQSYFTYLEMSAIIAKHGLKLPIKKESFSHQLYLEELAWFSCLFGPLNHYYNSAHKTWCCSHFSQNFITVLWLLCRHRYSVGIFYCF